MLGAWKGGEGGESDGGESDGGEGGERAGRFDANFSCFRATQERVCRKARAARTDAHRDGERRERGSQRVAERRRESKSPIRSNIFRLDEAWTRPARGLRSKSTRQKTLESGLLKYLVTMPEETIEQLLSQLEDKVRHELVDLHYYEALQYVQSFVARKKKILGVRGVSQAVFLGARLLANDTSAEASAAGGAAGNLVKWLIEEGAGADHPFHVHADNLNSSNYCDLQNLLDLLTALPASRSGSLVSVVYNPFHLLLTKRKIKRHSALALRINKLENAFAGVFLASKNFHQAFKCYSRLDDADKLCNTLVAWADEAYATERPLFFGRALLTLLAESKVNLARDLLFSCSGHVNDNIAAVGATQTPGTGGGPQSASLAVYHVGVTLTELAALPPHDRVNKPRLFILVYRRYASLFAQLDTKLLETLVKAGEAVFHFDSAGVPGGSAPRDAGPSPMALLQQMLTGGAPQAPQQPQRPAFDINTIMSLLGKMNAAQR